VNVGVKRGKGNRGFVCNCASICAVSKRSSMAVNGRIGVDCAVGQPGPGFRLLHVAYSWPVVWQVFKVLHRLASDNGATKIQAHAHCRSSTRAPELRVSHTQHVNTPFYIPTGLAQGGFLHERKRVLPHTLPRWP
jgi:hypothetical protein